MHRIIFDLYCVYVCIFVIYIEFFLIVSLSVTAKIASEMTNTVSGWGIKLYSIQSNTSLKMKSTFGAQEFRH